MTPLLAHLLAGGPSGVWRVERFGDVQQDLARSFKRSVLIIDPLSVDDKAEIMAQLAAGFDLPDWFGHNWDALYDSLLDLPPERWPDLIVLKPASRQSGPSAANLTVLADIASEITEARGGCFLLVGPHPADVTALDLVADQS